MANLAPSGKWDARYVVDVSQLSTCSLAHRCLSRYLGPVPHDASYYAKCMLGGALACGFTHAGITPLKITNSNMQVCISSSLIPLLSCTLSCKPRVDLDILLRL